MDPVIVRRQQLVRLELVRVQLVRVQLVRQQLRLDHALWLELVRLELVRRLGFRLSRERRRTSLPLSVAWFGAGLVAVAIAAGVLANGAWSGPRPNGPLAVGALAALM